MRGKETPLERWMDDGTRVRIVWASGMGSGLNARLVGFDGQGIVIEAQASHDEEPTTWYAPWTSVLSIREAKAARRA